MGFYRKLEDILWGLTLPAEQEKVAEFLANAENVQRINGLVEDIHESLMDYQVCILNYSFSNMFDIHARLHCNKRYTMQIVNSL